MSNYRKFKVVLTGAESTAKTSTAIFLAKNYKDLWLPEFARYYMKKVWKQRRTNHKQTINELYTYEDVLKITEEQIRREKKWIEKAKKVLFVDTSFIIIKIWFLEVFGKYPLWLDDIIEELKPDLYLLMFPDIEWKFDVVRENSGERRFYLTELYISEIKKTKVPYFIIKGIGTQRFKNALEAVKSTLNLEKK